MQRLMVGEVAPQGWRGRVPSTERGRLRPSIRRLQGGPGNEALPQRNAVNPCVLDARIPAPRVHMLAVHMLAAQMLAAHTLRSALADDVADEPVRTTRGICAA